MTVHYPQAVATLQVVWEDFNKSSDLLVQQKYTVEVMAKRTRVSINSYTEADTFELELDYKTFPFDPRCIRSCQVTVHMEDVGWLHDGAGFNRLQPTVGNAVFMGFADTEEMNLDDAQQRVRLKGRDLTSLFIDTTWDGTLVNLSSTVDVVLRRIVDRLPGAKEIKVENRTNQTLPVLSRFYGDLGTLAGQRNARKDETYWDVIQDICSKAGLVAYMELDKLVVTRPRTLYDPNKAVQLVYGRNLKNLELRRSYGRQKGFNVRVRSLIGRQVEAVDIPRESTRLPHRGRDVVLPKQDKSGNLQPEPAPFTSFVVANVGSRSHLIEVGEKIYEEMSRQQIEGKLSTAQMEAPEGTASPQSMQCFDMTKLRNGTPIRVVVDFEDMEAISQQVSVEERKKYLIGRCYPLPVANALATQIGKFSTIFYTRSVDLSMDANQGFRADVDFVNFIETDGLGVN